MICSFDIETIPSEAHLAHLIEAGPDKPFVAPSHYKDADKIAAYLESRKKDWLEGLVKICSIDPFYGRICSIAMHNDQGGGVLTLGDTGDDEALLIRETWAQLKDMDGIVTFNGAGFDWRWLKLRSAINWIPVLRNFDTRRYHVWPNCDLMLLLADFDRDKWKSLAEMCRVFGVECKGKAAGMDGSQVYALAQEGRWAEIADYNLNGDAVATWKLYEVLREMEVIPPAQER